MMLAAWRGQEQEATELIEATVREATTRGQGFSAGFADCAAAVLYNAQGRYGDARDAARRVLEHQVVGAGAFAVPELAESAARTGEVALVRTALAWLSERTRMTPTKWALGSRPASARCLPTMRPATWSRSNSWPGRAAACNSPVPIGLRRVAEPPEPAPGCPRPVAHCLRHAG